ncbi:hypothetical protein PYW07_005064 [Mythimna separata]|uniref:Protein-lysine N-methyltransferase SMYD4 n=1 Tax=Mythimna separata TaxID=271217 RepID=A0AAD8DPK8_MYTSE|nr:hypothetical protein PYW07_005064 [Mythimna separata]
MWLATTTIDHPFPNIGLPIDSVYERLLNHIKKDGRTKDISQDFMRLTEPYQKVFFVYKLLKNYELIPVLYKEEKSDYTSNHYRNLGNKAYQRGHNYTAWQYYNLALMYAPLESETFSLAISNRSAVFASLKKYKECISDIEMVFSNTYPKSLKDKLDKRQKSCEKALLEDEYPEFHDEEDEEIRDIFTFKGTKHEKFVDASSKLRVKYTPEMGRHVIAEEDIQVGEILVQEAPFVSVLLKDQMIFTCANCFSRTANLYPCPYCCMSLYCGKKCVMEAWDDFHFFECPLLVFLLNNSHFTKLELLALRATVKSRMAHSQLPTFFRTVDKLDARCYGENLGCTMTEEGKLVYSSKYFESIHTLATNVEKRDVSDLFQKAVSAAVLMHILAVKNFVAMENPEIRRNLKIYTANTLMRHLMTAPTNMHGITSNIEDEDGNYVDEVNIGCGAYPFLSLINHSCAPNVVRFTKLGTNIVTLFALRPIKKGEQILDNYGYSEMLRDVEMYSGVIAKNIPMEGPARVELKASSDIPSLHKKAHHAVHTREARQKILRSQYKFTCICEACTEDYPLYQDLKTVPNLPTNIVDRILDYLNADVIDVLQKANKRRAQKLFKPLCELATALEPYIPCKEAADCQEALKQCLAILSGVLAKGYEKSFELEIPAPTGRDKTRFYCGDGAKNLLKEFCI